MKPRHVTVINGPNLNLLGKREPEIYGDMNFDQVFEELQGGFPDLSLSYFQSNHEGELVSKIQEVGFSDHGIVFNPGGYSHTSVALADAVAAINSPVVEVHISNIFSREEFRKHSYISPVSAGVISGFGIRGYHLALTYLSNL